MKYICIILKGDDGEPGMDGEIGVKGNSVCTAFDIPDKLDTI